MPHLDIQITEPAFLEAMPKIKAFCRKIIKQAWCSYEPAEISLVLADDDFIRDLNNRYRGKNMPTNVLSFESGIPVYKTETWLAGDIVISYQTVLKEAKAQDKSFDAHLCHLLIHGALHLQGYDHLEEKQAVQMEAIETFLVQKQGYENPYKDEE